MASSRHLHSHLCFHLRSCMASTLPFIYRLSKLHTPHKHLLTLAFAYHATNQRQQHNQSGNVSDGFDNYGFEQPYPLRQPLNYAPTPWQGGGPSRLSGNHPLQLCDSSYDKLLQAYRKLQCKLDSVKTALWDLQAENDQLQQDLDIERNTKGRNNAMLYRCLPAHLYNLVTGHTKFKQTFSKTAKNMKGHIVKELRKAAPLIIKGVDPAHFAAKGDWSNVKELIALLSWQKRKHTVDLLAPILYPREVRKKGKVNGFKRLIFQSPELFQFICVLLFGQSSLGGTVSKKSYGVVWGVWGVKDLDSTIIPVFAVLVLCILSKDTEVAAVGPRTGKKWQELLEWYLGELYKLKEERKEEYSEVMDLFEAIVFNKTPESREEEDLGSLNLFEESAIFEDDEAEVSWRNQVTHKDNFMDDGDDDLYEPFEPTTAFRLPTPPPATPSPPATPPPPPPTTSPPPTPLNLSAHPLQPAVPIKPCKRRTRAAPMELQNSLPPLPPAAHPLPPPPPPLLPPLPLPPLPKVPPKPAKPRTAKAKPLEYPAHTMAQKESTTALDPIPTCTTTKANKVTSRCSNKGKGKATPNNNPPEQDVVPTDHAPRATGPDEVEEVIKQPFCRTLRTRSGHPPHIYQPQHQVTQAQTQTGSLEALVMADLFSPASSARTASREKRQIAKPTNGLDVISRD
ncbi:hypothetical protein B0H34DRAFT_676384 [Crassisporium funariophilum]|nr:hypothetical protein B0H34DRAFT_676384 [Crassisporium funariophilum]